MSQSCAAPGWCDSQSRGRGSLDCAQHIWRSDFHALRSRSSRNRGARIDTVFAGESARSTRARGWIPPRPRADERLTELYKDRLYGVTHTSRKLIDRHCRPLMLFDATINSDYGAKPTSSPLIRPKGAQLGRSFVTASEDCLFLSVRPSFDGTTARTYIALVHAINPQAPELLCTVNRNLLKNAAAAHRVDAARLRVAVGKD